MPPIVIAHFRSDIVSGAERSIADLTDHLAQDFNICMLVPKSGELAQFFQERGFSVWVREVQNFRRRYPGLHWAQSWLFARELKKRKVRVVLCNTFSAASRVGTACRMAGIPYAIYIREFITDRPINRKILSGATKIFTISEDLRSYIRGMTAPERVLLTYNHINPKPILTRAADHQASGKRLLPFEPHHPVVGLVGRITPFKQQDLFVRAAPLVLARVPDARFVVIGSAQGKDLEYEMHVKQLAKELGVAEKIAFMGHRSDSIELTSELTISCLTSTREPLGRVILEAHLLGCPVISPASGGAAEIVDDEQTGLKFDSTGPDACTELAAQIVRLLEDGNLRSSLAARASEKVHNTFASDRYVRIQADLINELCQNNHHNGY